MVFSLLCITNAKSVSAITIDVVPNSQTVQTGDAFAVDVVVSGLSAANEIVSAYDLNIGYDASILNATAVSFGAYLDDLAFPGLSFQDAVLTNPGSINIAEVSLLSDAELALQQPDSFTIATLSFKALMAGVSPIAFAADPVYGIDVKGTNANILSLDVSNGTVTVKPGISVPEPNTLALMLIAFVGLPLTQSIRRRRTKSAGET